MTKNDASQAGTAIDREQFLKIWGFMLTDLKLEKTELMIYAIIFSMHRNYCDCYMGSRGYLEGWSNASKSSVEKALRSLEKKNLIRKDYRQYGHLRRVVYFINTESLPTLSMFALENRNRDNNEKIRCANVEN